VRLESGIAGIVAVGLLAACASTETQPEHAAQAGRQVQGTPGGPAPGAVMTGASSWSMAEQYTPRVGAPVGTGASAWVPPAPPPAFVLTEPLPPAAPTPPSPFDPPEAPPAPPASAASAADIVRPEAAAPAAAPPPVADPAVRTRGLALFNDYSCGTCHALADAGASGAIGPSLDRNPGLTRDFSITVITEGRGAMPGFGGLMTTEEIATLSDYIVQHARR
jgi:mono/diheme cytochrome c family protein